MTETDLARENAELREGIKFVQLERDNRTSAYEIGVKLIGELQASNMRLREALNDLLGDCLESGDVPNQPFVKAPHHDSITDAENALAETPAASLEAIRAEAKAEEREAWQTERKQLVDALEYYAEPNWIVSGGRARMALKAIRAHGDAGEK